jgi:hypothetical protein
MWIPNLRNVELEIQNSNTPNIDNMEAKNENSSKLGNL